MENFLRKVEEIGAELGLEINKEKSAILHVESNRETFLKDARIYSRAKTHQIDYLLRSSDIEAQYQIHRHLPDKFRPDHALLLCEARKQNPDNVGVKAKSSKTKKPKNHKLSPLEGCFPPRPRLWVRRGENVEGSREAKPNLRE